jgi:hypothetical protein
MNRAAAWEATQRHAIDALDAALNNPTGADTHRNFGHFFRSIGISEPERRMRRDLKRTLMKNKRIYRTVQEHMVRNPYGLDAAQKKAIMNERNENLYYGYIYQMWINDEIRVGPTPEQWFRRILDFLAKQLGFHTAEQFSEEFFSQIRSRNVASHEDVGQFYQQQATKFDNRVSDLNSVMREGTLRFIGTGLENLRELDIPEAQYIADLFDPGQYEQGMTADGFIPKRQQQINAWQNRMRNQLDKKYTKAELDTGWQGYRVGDLSSTAAQDIDTFVREFYRYLNRSEVRVLEIDPTTGRKTYVTPGSRRWKVPSAWDSTKVRNNKGAFTQLLVDHGLTLEQAERFVESILWADGHVSFVDSKFDKEFGPNGTGVFSGFSQVVNANNATEFAEFMSDDADYALLRMVQQGVHKAEFTKRFGAQGEKIEQFLERLRQRNLSPARYRYIAERVIPGLLGTLTYNMNPRLRHGLGSIIGLQNMAILPLILFSSFPEIWGSAVASKDFNNAFDAAKEGFAEIGRSLRYGKEGPQVEPEMEQLGRLVGAISDDVMTNRINDVFNDMMVGTRIKKMNERFFRITLIEQWTKGLRVSATRAAVSYISDHRDNEKKLGQVGLKPENLRFHENGELDLTGLDGDPDSWSAEDKALSMAIFRFVDQSVLRPSSAHRPAWGNDPRFLFVWHLKQFTFSFHQVFTKHIMKTFMARDSGDHEDKRKMLAAYMMMLPTIIFTDMIKNTLFPGTWWWWDRMSLEQAVYLETSRSGIAGIGSFVLDEMLGTTFRQPFGYNFLGPTFENLAHFADGEWAKAVLNFTPGGVLLKKWNFV